MKKHLQLIFLFSISFTVFGQQTYETMTLNGTTREYYQYLPTGYDPGTEQLPVLFMLHGIGGTASNTSTYGMNAIADTGRFIMIYPQGLPNFQSQTAWNNGTLLASDGEDILLISSIIDSLNTNQNIDLSRVYVSGISMGAIMTYNLCRYLNDRIAAAVCLIGTMSTIDLANYTPEYPVPILHKHGTADGTVPYDGTALTSLSLVQETIDQLKISNGWLGDSTITAIPDLASDGITIDRITYNATTPFELWRMNNAGHILLFEPLNDTNTSEMTWAYLAQYSHPNPSTAAVENFSIPIPEFYPNPTRSTITLENADLFRTLEVFDMSGKLVHTVEELSKSIDFSSLEPGSYLLRFTDQKHQIYRSQIVIE